MRERRLRGSSIVGLVLLWTALPRAAGARITFVQEEGIENGHFEYQFIGDVQVSPDGRYVYATAGYPQNRILIYERSPDVGTIVEVATVDPQAAGGVEILAFGPGGAHLYALDYNSGAIVTYARDATTGLLTRLGIVQPPTSGTNQQWQGLALSPDGAHVYATSSHRGIAVYARDASTGLPTLVDVESGFAGITAAVGLKLSPDGAHVYVACYRIDGGILVLARDAVTGQLTEVQDIEDGDGGQTLKYQFAVDVAPDGAYVYVSGTPGISVFKRDATTGMLTRVQATNDGMSHDIWLTADGSHAYACGNISGIRRYARDPVTGVLTTEDGYLPFDEGFPPPLFCFGMTITPDARNLYTIVTYDIDDPVSPYFYTLGVFRQTNATCAAAPLTTCQAPAAGGASIDLRDATSARLSWKWKGQVSTPDFGDPVGGATDAALCVYDSRGSLVGIVAPGSSPCSAGRPCWQAHAQSDLRYTDSKARRDGIRLVKLQERRPGDVRLDVEARGDKLFLPNLPMAGVVTVQLQIADGTSSSCYGATYSSQNRNSFAQYRAVSDP